MDPGGGGGGGLGPGQRPSSRFPSNTGLRSHTSAFHEHMVHRMMRVTSKAEACEFVWPFSSTERQRKSIGRGSHSAFLLLSVGTTGTDATMRDGSVRGGQATRQVATPRAGT